MNPNMALEGLTASCMSFPLTCISLVLASPDSNDITNFFVKTNLVKKIAKTSTYDISMCLN